MALLIEAETRLEAWLRGTEHLLAKGADLNLILSINRPGSDGNRGRAARDLVDELLVAEDVQTTHTVAETIFPAWQYRRRGLHGLRLYAEEEYPRLKRNDARRWGTYAYRIIERVDSSGTVHRPLELLIEKMRGASAPGGGHFHSCYELDIAGPAYDIATYHGSTDERRRRGGPCLSHLSFKLHGNQVHLTAIYRSHDYRHKVVGNLLGLARLQACVAREVGIAVGSLVIHSTYAYLPTGRRKNRLVDLLNTIRDLPEESR